MAQAGRGGRHDEYARLLAAVLTGFPRALDEVTGLQSQAIARNHGLPQAWLMRAMEYGFAGRDAQAKADCDQALRLRPDYALALLLRAQVDDEHPAAERADIDAAIAAAPRQPKCLLVRAHLRQAVDPAGALADLRQAVAVGGAGYRGTACRELADRLRELGRRDEAIAACRAVGDDESRLALAELLAADREAAERELAPLLGDAPPPARLPVCVQAREWRAKARAVAGDHQAALDDWRWVVTHAPNVLTARVGEGRELAALGHRAQALAALDAAVAALVAWAAAPGPGVKPETAVAYVGGALVARATLRRDTGDAAGARVDVDEALRRRADDPDALALSAALLREVGDAAGAAVVESRRVAALIAAGDARRARYELIAAEESYRAALVADAGSQAANAGLRAIAELRASVK
jgi:tetratricopeptide (TPR) repeat protein